MPSTAGDLRSRIAGACGALRVFPLEGVVVFPGTPTPFHVFEPRYRALTADAIAGDGTLAVPCVAPLASAGGAAPRLGPGGIHPIAGAGIVEEHRKLPDGRYHILVRGAARVRLLEEVPSGAPYRAFRAELLDDVLPAGGEAALAGDRAMLEQLLVQLATSLPAGSGATLLARDASRLGASALADLAAAALVTDAATRQRLLEALDVAGRLDLVVGEVAALVLQLGGGGRLKV